MSDDVLRKRLKVHFKMAGQAEEVVSTLGRGTKLHGFKKPSFSTSVTHLPLNSPCQVTLSHSYKQNIELMRKIWFTSMANLSKMSFDY